MSTDYAIDARLLVRKFGEKTAVDGINISVSTGEIYGFLGPNGAGKSTTLRMLTTLLVPTAGSATVAGFDIATQADEVRLRIGVALQDTALDPKQSGRELLDMQGRLYGLSARERKDRISYLLDIVNIGDAIDDRIKTYSGGMKRRLDLAAALVHQPEVLFLDEPTAGLDPVSRATVWDEVRYLNEKLGMTIMLTTQYLEEADALAHRVGIIAKGRLVAEGTPTELKRSIGSDVIIARVPLAEITRVTAALASVSQIDRIKIRHDEAIISVANGAATISPVAVALSGANITVIDLTLRTPTLDDVFLQTTGERMQDREAVVTA